jgi:hypothetical protein
MGIELQQEMGSIEYSLDNLHSVIHVIDSHEGTWIELGFVCGVLFQLNQVTVWISCFDLFGHFWCSKNGWLPTAMS